MPRRSASFLPAALALSCAFASLASAQSADLLYQARVARADGDPATAIAVLEGMPRSEMTGEAVYLLATSYQALARHSEAVALLAAPAEVDYDGACVLSTLARSYDALGQQEDAIAAYESALAADSTSIPVALSLARLYASTDQHQRAATLYGRLLASDAKNPTLHAYLGSAYQSLGLADSAIVPYQTAHRLNPSSVSVALALSRVYAGVDHLISARRVTERALLETPTSTPLWVRRGEIAIKEEDFAVADTAYAEALALGDSSAAVWRGLGVAQYFLGQIDSAQVALLASFEADSTHAMTPFYLGMTYQAQEEWDDALGYFDVAARNMGRGLLADLYAQIATTYDRMDRDGDAIQSYRTVQGLTPERNETLFHLAALYDTYYADRTAALRQYEAFLTRTPEGTLPQFRSYALERVRVLREEMFFQPAPAQTDTVRSER